ncbi:MAG: histidine kinase [Gemmatimonadaceae bacterium]|nr:histidine kinase [Gemmatimonadaceae bacterium]
MSQMPRSFLPDGWRTRWLLLAWSVPAVLGVPFTLVSRALGGDAPALWRSLVIVAVCWWVWVPISVIVAWLTDRVPPTRPWTGRVLLVHVGAALGASLLQGVAAGSASHMLAPAPGATLAGTIAWWCMLLTPGGVLVYGAVVAVRASQRHRAQAERHARDAQQLTIRLAEAQLSALRAQLRPHFLFNTLNAVVALVRDGDRAAATDALLSLSRLLRATIEGDARHQVALRDELRFTREYLALEQLRIGERLAVHVSVPEALLDIAVPSLVLQPLVENAVRHGVARVEGPVSVSVDARSDGTQLVLRVSDDGAGLSLSPARPGVGLGNVRARLEQLHGSRAALDVRASTSGRGTIAEVRVPLERAA